MVYGCREFQYSPRMADTPRRTLAERPNEAKPPERPKRSGNARASHATAMATRFLNTASMRSVASASRNAHRILLRAPIPQPTPAAPLRADGHSNDRKSSTSSTYTMRTVARTFDEHMGRHGGTAVRVAENIARQADRNVPRCVCSSVRDAPNRPNVTRVSASISRPRLKKFSGVGTSRPRHYGKRKHVCYRDSSTGRNAQTRRHPSHE